MMNLDVVPAQAGTRGCLRQSVDNARALSPERFIL